MQTIYWIGPLNISSSLGSHIHPHNSPFHGWAESMCPFFIAKDLSSSDIALCILKAKLRRSSQC